jgi:excinuclease ABC subunit C
LYQIRRCSGPCVGHIGEAEYARDVQLAKLFLGGKAHEVIRQLGIRMEDAASRLEFELAATYRDQIAQVGKLRDRQYVTGTNVMEADIVVAVQDHGVLCINIAMVRFGEHLGDKPIFPQHSREWSAEEALGDFLRQHYGAHPVPARIVCNFPVAEEVSEDLGLLAGTSVRIGTARGEEQRAWVDMAEKNARLAIEARRVSEESRMRALDTLRDALGLDDAPLRIECFDISHTQGETAVASCVVCISGQMVPGQYRRFNISKSAGGDDFASIAQAVRRRYERVAAQDADAIPMPDLIVIDGGAGQLHAARAALRDLGIDDSIPMIGVAKGAGRKEGLEKIVRESGRMPLQLNLTHPGFRLLIEIRNEAHRFAISGHRARRAKPRRESVLDEVPGIGPRRRKALLTHFGSLSGVKDATVDQLSSVSGISRTMAEQIYQAFH